MALPTFLAGEMPDADKFTDLLVEVDRNSAYGNSQSFAGASGVAGNTVVATYANIGYGSISFTKRRADTRLRLELHVSVFVTVATTTAQFAAQVNGVDYDVFRKVIYTASQYQDWGGVTQTPAIPAGLYVVQPRWKRTAGTGAVSTDGGGWLSLSVTEIAP